VDHWGTNGARYSGRYLYVDGYRVQTDDDERVTTSDVRLEMMSRAKVFASEQAMLDAMTNG
jgi:hypothetical protein